MLKLLLMMQRTLTGNVTGLGIFTEMNWILRNILTVCCAVSCPRPYRVGSLSDDARLTSDVSVAYIGPKSRTERPRKTKIGTEVAHVTRDSDTAFNVKRSKVNFQGRGHILAASRVAYFKCICLKYVFNPFTAILAAASVCFDFNYCWCCCCYNYY